MVDLGADSSHAATPRHFRFAPVRRLAGVGQRYSRFVGMMRLVLPLVALGLVVIVIAWPNGLDRDDGFQISFADMRPGEAGELTMLRPRYLGTDSRNRPFVVTADRATQDPDDQRLITLRQLQADMTTAGGGWFTVLAEAGVYHQQRQQLHLQGPINIFSDSGYEFHAQAVDIDLIKGRAVSDQPVRGQGPFGTLRADRLVIEDQGGRMQFQGNVKMRIAAPGRG
ncbi:MAG: LPS export ABC transporter periplasmic protein LptC [Alphaproteobacteria bacterium]|jgi:lipopolysaccharide export system protein LptC|nr:LPS export ABC transporter periplasmic protein LptC [Alphaproteobacteria bacterium]MDP6563617.1 LPS export ABC transporter periplasmic protein LptC [Alphaproteobacteria bacterium]MDP6814588.1 LPS export ABC transporter periplasmic protein LptC [Alphaproteobacteria bacterium]